MPETQTIPAQNSFVEHGLRSDNPKCALCGLPIHIRKYHEEKSKFCCPGCQRVFEILSNANGVLPQNFRETDVFRACFRAGIIPDGQVSVLECSNENANEDGFIPITLDLHVHGMWCPACAWVIQEVLRKTEGIAESRVSFLTDSATVRYLPHRTSPAEIIDAIGKIGYRASTGKNKTSRTAFDQGLLVRLGISAILTANIMMLSYALYAGFFRNLTTTVLAYFGYPIFLMTLPVVFYAGMPVIKSAWTGLQHSVISTDTLISVSALSAFLYSILRMIQGSPYSYFDTTAILITIVLLGRHIEVRLRRKILDDSVFDETTLTKVRMSAGSREYWLNADVIVPGSRFIVRKGERVPVDGRITAGKCKVNQSVLTGESNHVRKSIGDPIMAGSLLINGDIEVTATTVSGECLIQQISESVIKALEQVSPDEQLSDRISRLFVPAVLSTATITALMLLMTGNPADEILSRFLAVLLISCPCTLGIAIPLLKVVFVGLGRKYGLIIIEPGALQKVRKLDTIVLDKTGTITEGVYRLRDIIFCGTNEQEALPLIAGLEAESDHFLAREIRRYSALHNTQTVEAQSVEKFDGAGIAGTVGKMRVFAGNRDLMSRLGVLLPKEIDTRAANLEECGMTVVFFGWDMEVRGILSFGDRIKDGTSTLLEYLVQRGIRTILVSGDAHRTTRAVASLAGITEAWGGMMPDDKVQFIKNLQEKGNIVGMVGDGINDAGALARANVSFALAPVFKITQEAAAFIVPSGGPAILKNAFRIAFLSEKAIRQNLFLSFAYNSIAIPIAVAGFLNPVMAVLAMFASSLTVIGNSLRFASKSLASE